jgi:hypothetical protein
MALLLYTSTAIALLALVHRLVTPLPRLAALILILLPFVFAGPALLTSRVYGPVDLPYTTQPLNHMKEAHGIGALHNAMLSDLYGQMIPWRQAVRHSIARGEWPLWNPFILSGDILAASAQPAPYSPFTLLALLLPVPLSLTFSAAIAHFLAALGAYLFARELGCSDVAALLAGAGFTCATSIAFFILWPLGLSWTFLPFVLLGIRRASYGILTCAFTLLLLAGHPETALHIVFISGAYVLTLRSRRAIGVAIAAGVTALALSAIFVLPVLEAAPQTMEHATRTGMFKETPRGAPAEQVLARLATDVVPYLHARQWAFGALPVDTSSAGSIVLALAIYALWRVRRAETWFFAVLALFGLLAHAEWTPVARALQKLPLLDVALNERFSFAAAFALVMLAALGVEHLEKRGAVGTFIVVLVFIAIANFMAMQSPLVNHDAAEWGRFAIAAEVAGLAVATAAVAVTKRAAPLLLGLLLIQRVLTVGGIYKTFPQSAAYPPIPIFASLPKTAEPFRITGHGRAFIPGTSAMYGLEDVRGYQAMTFLRYRDTYPVWSIHQPVWFNRVDDLTRPFLSFLNVRYAITWDRDPPPGGWIEAARQPGTLLFENTRVIERVFLPRRVRIGESVQNTIAGMAAETDFRERAWIEADAVPYERENGPGRITFKSSHKSFDIDAQMERDGWIVISVPAWKGWRATVDGQRVKVQFANHAFVAVHVPPGRHRVQLEFLPRGFVVGRSISAIAFAGLLVIAIVRTQRRSVAEGAGG